MIEPVGVLGEIAAAKRNEIACRFDGVSLDALRAQARTAEHSLAGAIASPGSSFVLEIKKASPSAGAIRSEADAGAIARGYAGVADALSVLTDRKYFGGSTTDLAEARSAFDGPILAKDFFIDRRQVTEARIAGADAILVMLSLLDDANARQMIAEARLFGMDTLVEVHDEAEMRRALALGGPVIGINNRDLRDLSIDLSTTERLAPLAANRLVVSESGINGRADVDRLSDRVNGFLVGSALMRTPKPAEAARELQFGRVKLCGLTKADDVRTGRAAAFAGFMFAPGSSRRLTPEQAAPLAGRARRFGMAPVGVFRDAPIPVIADVAASLELEAVQLHGREDIEYVSAIKRRLPAGCEIWTAASVDHGSPRRRGGDRTLFDSGSGGTGRAFDWELVRRHPDLPRGLLAGGIGPCNARAAAALGAYAIDVGSSLDVVPGTKSPKKIRALFDALRAPCREQFRACA
jgi:indole-3-glycerol phosphate synthase/phosphoribosylanthranilate isomerase